MPLRTRSIVQSPVILNPAILKDKHYGRRDLYARMELQTECVSIVPDVRTLLKNLNGLKRDGQLYQSTIYKVMLCQPPAKRVSIDWEGKRIGTGAGVHRLQDDRGITLRQVLEAYVELKRKSLEIVDIRIPGVFFVTEREWDWVHGKYKFPGPSSQRPRTPLEDLPFAVDPYDRDDEKQERDAGIAKIGAFLPSGSIHDLQQLRGLRVIKKGLWAQMKKRKFLTGAPLAKKMGKIARRRFIHDDDSDDSLSGWSDIEDENASDDSFSDWSNEEDEEDKWAKEEIVWAQIRQMREVMRYRRAVKRRDDKMDMAEKEWVPLPDGTARSYSRPHELLVLEC